jgi:hypothetical protein
VWLELEPLEQLDQPAPPVGGLEGHRGAGWQPAKDRLELGRVIGDVAVALHGTGLVDDGDLGALAVHVHADVHSHCGPPSLRSSIPGAQGCRAEQGMGPDLHSVSSSRLAGGGCRAQ